MFRLFSHHWERCLGGRAWTRSRQGQRPLRTHSELTFALCQGPDYLSLTAYPFALSRTRLPAWNICAPWLLFLCLQSCWFPVREHGLGKIFRLVSWKRRSLAVSLVQTVCVDVARGYFYKLALLTLQDLLFSLPLKKKKRIAFKLSKGWLFQVQNDKFLLGLIFLPDFICAFRCPYMLTAEAVC